MNLERLTAYRLVAEEWLEDLNSQAYLLRHIKSGARLFLVSNEDRNKVFTIGFRTPPENSTGVAHIMEHSVLCGSEKFPLKDPFVELAKGSLNTFLNAMTYPDKTVYPVASCNDKDFQNLIDVYLDAVLHPNIYKNEKIFRQEGWHYELSDVDAPLTINGVVYNEMRGAFSSSDSVLDRRLHTMLFPDTTYGQESGGDPEVIPELTYEEFLDFHRRYYHPSNSYIYLYGDMDMEEKLEWLDQAYLKDFDAITVDSEIKIQAPFAEPVRCSFPYSVEADSEEGSYLNISIALGADMDPNQYLAWNVLDYALLDASGAPLKEALINKKLCKDVSGGTDTGLRQSYFSVTAKQADPDRLEEFLETVHEVLTEQVEKGLNQKSLAANLNSSEFRVREADFGSMPKGLIYGLQCFDSWLYDENDPFSYLRFSEAFAYLREQMDKGYFEGLIKDYLLDNPHQVQILMYPEEGLAARKEEAQKEKLASIKAGMSKEELEQVVADTIALKAYQEEEDPSEVVELLPLLSREDIGKKAAPEYNELRHEEGGDVMLHELFTGGITYMRVLFDTHGLSAEELQYAALLRSLMIMLNTEHYTYGELADEIGIHCGGLGCSLGTYTSVRDNNEFLGMFQMYTRVLSDNVDFAFTMMKEILLTSDLTDTKRIGDLLSMLSTRMQVSMADAGHATAVGHANAAYSRSCQYNELISGLEYARFIVDLERHYEARKEEVVKQLKQVSDKLIRASRMLVSVTTDAAGYAKIPAELNVFTKALQEAKQETEPASSLFRAGTCDYDFTEVFAKLKPGSKIALTTQGQVQYVACGGDYHYDKLNYDGALRVMNVILGYDYLWLNVRVKGGAYGCMSGFYRNGESYLVSYRDPNLTSTLQVYEGIPEYLRSFEADEREMTKYIIGTVSDLDTPRTPRVVGDSSLSNWLCGITQEEIQETRDRILSCQEKDIRNMAPYVEALLAHGTVCVVGSENKIEAEKQAFDVVEPLFPKG